MEAQLRLDSRGLYQTYHPLFPCCSKKTKSKNIYPIFANNKTIDGIIFWLRVFYPDIEGIIS